MDYTSNGGRLLKILVLTTCISPWMTSALSTVTACHGTQHFDCDYFEMRCTEPGARIHVTRMLYGFKDYTCSTKANRCMTASRNGCCAFKVDDCFDAYTPLHAYYLHTDCSMQVTCGPLQAPNHKLPQCQNQLSTYVYLSYECVPFNKTNTINFCEDRVIYPYEGISNIIFDASTNRYTGNTCTCSITSLLKDINTTYADIRMFKHKTGSGSSCSSAKLTSSNPDFVPSECNSGADEEDNFIYQAVTVNGEQLKIYLTDLNNSGPDDVPSLIWILVENAVRIECVTSSTPPTEATLPQSTSLPATNTANTTVLSTESLEGDDGVNTAAIAGAVGGVLVVILIVIAVVLVFVYKRRGNGPKKTMSRSNTYSAQKEENVYDEIKESEPDNIYDPVYEPQKHPPIYDPVYEPRTSHGASDKTINCGLDNITDPKDTYKRKAGITKRLKTPFTKMFSYIRSRTGEEPKRKTSYDHLHVTGVITDISSDEEPRHAYSHVTGEKKGVTPKEVPIILTPVTNQTTAKLTDTQTINSAPTTPDVKAVGVGDFYIEFKTGVDDNDPNLVKMEDIDATKSNLRLADPPSLNPSRAPSPLPKPTRSASPMKENNSKLISKDTYLETQDNTPDYDYAVSNRPNSNPDDWKSHNFVSPEISSTGVTVVEGQPDYDYASSDGEEPHTNPIYEDVEKRHREASMKKHKSEADLMNRLSGYEVPITQRQTSDPNTPLSIGSLEQGLNKTTDIRKPLKPLNNDKSNKILDLKSELQSRLQKKKLAKSNLNDVDRAQGHDLDNTVVKSDNLKTKDYETAPAKKTVLQMKKTFENK